MTYKINYINAWGEQDVNIEQGQFPEVLVEDFKSQFVNSQFVSIEQLH